MYVSQKAGVGFALYTDVVSGLNIDYSKQPNMIIPGCTLTLRSACKEIPELAASEMMAILYKQQQHM